MCVYSASSKAYQVLHDVLQRTEPTHKAGLGNDFMVAVRLINCYIDYAVSSADSLKAVFSL